MEEFLIKTKNNEILKGCFWKASSPKANLVIATGMQEYAGRYNAFATFLNSNNINVFCLDAPGQGLNVNKVDELQIWPDNGFSLYVDGIALTISKAKENKLDTFVFGHSMGSFIIQSLLERYPGIAKKTVICGSNGPDKILYSLGSKIAKLVVNKKNKNLPCPLLTNMGTGAYSKQIKNRKTDLDWLSYNEENVKNYINDPYCGHPNTGSFWKGFLKGMNTLYRHKNLKNISQNEDILIISGQDDPVGKMSKGPISLKKMYKKQGVKNVQLKLYVGMRHEILNEDQHDVVYNDILSFLK